MKPTEIAGLPLDQSALAPVEGFLRALQDKDQQAMSAVLYPGSWEAGENSPRGLAGQIMRKGFQVHPLLVGKISENRASVRALLTHPDQSDWAQSLWFLLAKGDEWLLAGVTKSRPLVGLFLRGLFMPGEELMAHPRAEGLWKWASSQEESLWRHHFEKTHLPEEQLKDADFSLEHACLIGERGVVLTEVRAGEKTRPLAFLLERAGSDNWTIRSAQRSLAMETIVDGLEIPWTEYKEEVPNVEG